MNFTHDKNLGQHFMSDQALLKRIVQAGEVSSEDTILEIGSGKGALTKAILTQAPQQLICIEIDKRLPSPDDKVNYLQGDAKDIISTLHFDKVIANLPYHETEPQLITLLKKKPRRMTIVVGETFANKLFADTIIGIIARSMYDIELIEHIPPEAFTPPPKVNSSLLVLQKKPETRLAKLLLAFYYHQRQKVKNYLLTIAKGVTTKKEVKQAWKELPKDLLEEQLYTLSTPSFKRIYTFIKDVYL